MLAKDSFNRPIISLRISITSRCNVKCLYCHHDGVLPQESEMTADEIFKIVQIAKNLGIGKIRLSGGEPLIRSDIVDIIEKISSLNFKDLSITTNGTLMEHYAQDLVNAGLKRVNISLDTLNPETYRYITNRDFLESAKRGIKAASKAGLDPVKVNMVVMKDINHDEIWDMFQFCKDNGAVLQLIELLKTESCPDADFIDEYHYKMDSLEEELAYMADEVKIRAFMQDRKKYFVDDGEIEIVKPMDNTEFCKNCTRLRITPDGKIKPCLLRNDNLVDIIGAVREGRDDKELERIFIHAIENRKPYYLIS